MTILSSPRVKYLAQRLKVVVFLSLFFIWTGVFAAEKIDINTAPLEELVKIIHIGETRARELISLRPFSSLDELTKIKGIGEARLQDIKEQGLAWIAFQSSEPELKPELEPKSEPEPQPKPESEKTAVEEPTVEVKLQQTYPTGIVINEILPSPEGPDSEEEWIEIFNQNNFEANLSDWQITDTEGKTTTYTFPQETKISPQGFLVLLRPTTKITLNNDGDGLNLIQPDGKIVDSVNYQKAPRGQSYNKTESGWVWSSVLTPGSVNITSLPATQDEISQKEKTEPNKELQKNQFQKQQLAAIGEQLPKTFNSLHIFLIALGLAIFSGIIILIIKRKLKDASDIN